MMNRCNISCLLRKRLPPRSTRIDTLFPYTTPFRSRMQPLAPGLFRGAQASRDVALLPQVRGAESEHRRPRRRVAGDLAALAVAASGHPVREPGGWRAVIIRDSF